MWSEQDAASAFQHIRETADAAFKLMLDCARPVLQHGVKEEAGLDSIQIGVRFDPTGFLIYARFD